MNQETEADFLVEEQRMDRKETTEKQKDLIKMYAKKANLDFQMCLDWVEGWKVTMSELSMWILWQRLN